MKKIAREKAMLYRKPKNVHKSGKKKEELPSFLSKMPTMAKEYEPLIKSTDSKVYTGAIFFGVCKRIYPPLHSLNLTSFKITQYIAPSRENFLEDILLPKVQLETKKVQSKPIRFKKPIIKKLYEDPCIHKCPGVRRTHKPKIVPPVIDLGQTTSKITGEISREIPYCRLRRSSLASFYKDLEVITLSDIRERNRMYLKPEERAAHLHFPKEFVSVQVNGPKIPASILITSIPSKRRKFSEYKYEVLSKISKTNEENDAENDFEGNWRQENKVNEVLENTLKTQNNGSKSKKQMSEKESKIVQVVFNGNRNMKR